jgi:hypothetical protein
MRFTFVILLFCCLGADAQMIIKAHANYRPYAVAAAQNLLLDDYPNAAAAYSLRKLDKDYTGSAIRVRRSNDNSEQDIGFTSGGDLDTASLKTFVGANSGFVTTWYNQGDSTSLDFTQTTAASQPRIINAGTIDRQNGDPSVFFDGSNDFMDVASSTNRFNYLHNGTVGFISSVVRFGIDSDPDVAYIFLDNKGTGSIARGYSFTYNDRSTSLRNNAYVVTIGRGNQTVVSNIVSDVITPNTLNLITQINDPSNATAASRNIGYVNNGSAIQENTSTNAASTGDALTNMRLGRISNSTTFPLLGNVSEIIIWNNNQSSNRTAIQNNINSYYGIY